MAMTGRVLTDNRKIKSLKVKKKFAAQALA
jgi:hypothetical protein